MKSARFSDRIDSKRADLDLTNDFEILDLEEAGEDAATSADMEMAREMDDGGSSLDTIDGDFAAFNSESVDLEPDPPDPAVIHAISTDVIPPISKTKAQFVFNGILQNEFPVAILADTGCTGNIIHPRLVRHIKKLPFNCNLTFGNESTSQSTCTVIQPVSFGKNYGYTRTIEFVVAETAYDVILGTPWFEAIDHFSVNWKKREFHFTDHGRSHKLRPTYFPELESAVIISTAVVGPQIFVSPSVLISQEDTPEETPLEEPNPLPKAPQVRLMPRSSVNRTLRQSAFAAMVVMKPEFLMCLDDPELFKREFHETVSADGKMEFLSAELVAEGYGKMKEFEALFDEFKGVFADPTDMPPSRPEDFKIPLLDETKKPPWRRIYKLSEEELDALRQRLKELLDKGFIRPSQSPYGAPILFAKKKDGGLRLCIDYRMLNKNTIKDVTPLPNIAELRDRFLGSKFFSKIDLRDGYYNIRIAENDIHKTAFQTRYGHYEFTVLPFGLTNAPATFMRMVNRIFGDLADDFVVAYLDDILIFSDTYEDHVRHVREVLQRLKDNTLFAKLSKCEFNVPEVEFCGHLVNHEGVKIHPRNITAVQDWPIPKDVGELRSFLGLINYFRDFIPAFADIALPLTELLKETSLWVWTPLEQSAMLTLIHYVTSAPVLTYYNPALPVHVFTDASGFAVSGWLGHEIEGLMKPVLYWSRKMKPAETRYVVLEQELLAIVDFLKHTRHYVLGKDLYAHTDHKALIYLDNQELLSRRQVRWVELLQEFRPKIEYIPGEWNTVADLLSRRPDYAPLCSKCRHPVVNVNAAILSDISGSDKRLDIIRKGLLNDDFALDTVIQLENPESIHKTRRHFFKQFTVKDNLLFYNNRLYVPDIPTLRTALLSQHHDPAPVGHPGWERTYRLLAREYYWPKMERDAQRYTGSCDSCQRNKHRYHLPSGELHPLPIPDERWESVGHDLAFLPMTSSGYDACDVWIDRLTKRVHLVPSHRSITALQTSQQFLREIYKHHGLPKSIISDRASTFTSKFAEHVFKALNVDLHIATSRHQQTDGQAENAIRQVKIMVQEFANYHQNDWDQKLWAFEFAFNNADNASTGYSPFYLDLAKHPRTPSSLDLDTQNPAANGLLAHLKDTLAIAQDHIRKAQDRQAASYNKRHEIRQHTVGSLVLLSREGITFPADSQRPNALLSPWLGPFQILEALPHDNYRLELPPTMKIHPEFHISKLTAYVEPQAEFPDRPLPPRPPPVDPITDSYEVAEILDSRKRKRTIEFLIRWKGYPPHEDTWEPRKNLTCGDLLKDFEASHPISSISKPPKSTRFPLPTAPIEDPESATTPEIPITTRTGRTVKKKVPFEGG